MDTRNKIFAVVGTVAILGTAGVVGALLFTQQDTTTDTATTSSQTTTLTDPNSSSSTDSSSSSSSGTATTGSYKDGTYSSTVSYSVPKGDTNSITVGVTISSGKITAVTTGSGYSDHESGEYISSFESSVDGVIVGQSLGSISSSRIGGASLTSEAFYEALDAVATQAQA